ncbi:hypothetical protein [Agreia bicolorata]|uniref:hypothetical protein n=1 Tax=Agreia bicolorata TaxID=110935 RepID=UPI000A6C9ADB|nr:hypothetical protein [Agreia bicolorata]
MDGRPIFAKITLSGERFAGGILPVGSLSELQRYQEVVLHLAEIEWHREHPNQDLPDDFADDFQLVIEGINDGSAEVLLALEQRTAYVEYQEEARSAFEVAISAAYGDQPIPELPTAVAEEVAGIGSTLAPNQRLSFYPADDSIPPTVVTVETRVQAVEKLQLATFWATEDPDTSNRLVATPDVIAGRIVELDPDKQSFRFNSLQFGEMRAHYKNADLTADMRALLDSTSEAPVTRLEGVVQYRNGQAWRIKDTFAVARLELDERSWTGRVASLAGLRPGWGDDSSSQAISFVALDAAREIMTRVEDSNGVLPSVFPVEEGGVLLEWANPDEVKSIEIGPDGDFELFHLPPRSFDSTYEETTDLAAAIKFALGGTE